MTVGDVYWITKLIDLKGFVMDLNPYTSSLQVLHVSNAFPRVKSVHKVTIDGVVDTG